MKSSVGRQLRPGLLLLAMAGLCFAEQGAPSRNAPILAQLPDLSSTGSNTFRVGSVEFDKVLRTVSIPARVRLRNEVVEYVLVTEQGKAYESLLTTEARPRDIHVGFLLLGMSPAELRGDPGKTMSFPASNAVAIEVGWTTNGRPSRFPLSDLVQLTSGKPDPAAPRMQTRTWFYNGSVTRQDGFAAEREGSIISLIPDPAALINNPGADREHDTIHFPNASLLPPSGTPVRVTFALAPSPPQKNYPTRP